MPYTKKKKAECIHFRPKSHQPFDEFNQAGKIFIKKSLAAGIPSDHVKNFLLNNDRVLKAEKSLDVKKYKIALLEEIISNSKTKTLISFRITKNN